MRYGYFDNEKKEYVIDSPDTPEAWANYLGSPEYGAIISNNAGGYSFERSGAKGRILRYVFDGQDRPGRYIYIRDNKTSDYWSASWQPVGKPLDQYRCITRHGLGYTIMESDCSGIHGKAMYYVPEGALYEVWALTVRNDSDRPRELTLTGFAEFTCHSDYEQDQVNLQYSRFITSTVFHDDRIMQRIHGNLDAVSEEGEQIDGKGVTERFFGLASADVSTYCGDRDAFLGRYHSYGNPVGVERGSLGNTDGVNGISCGALSTVIELAVGEERTIAFVLGMQHDQQAGEIVDHYKRDTKEVCEKEIGAIRRLWDDRLQAFSVKTPSPEFDEMVNIWNAYNCYMTFIWSRAASFVYCGLRNGYGYRDTVQDIQGIIHLNPAMAKTKLEFMLSAQAANGAGLPLVKFTHRPGYEDTPDDESYVKETGHPAYRADDALWLFPTVYKYIAETGDHAFLDKVIPFADKDQGSVFEHLKRALAFSAAHLGEDQLPAGLYADWNDCLRLGEKGESAFVAFQYYYAIRIQKTFAENKGEYRYAEELEIMRAGLEKLINEKLWDGDRFIRGITEDGKRIGAAGDPEASLWLNPQTWSVISGLASGALADKAMENVYMTLNTEYGAMLMDPPYHAHAFDGAFGVIYNQGTKENAGIFSQTQGWLVLAEALRGNGDKAFMYFMENNPAAWNDKAEIRRMEPYCYGQFTEGKASPHFGESHVHWLTGTASTMMVGAVEGILGIRPDMNGICISPSIPKEWDKLEIEKDFRGHRLHIEVLNPGHKESGCKEMTVNDIRTEDSYIPESMLKTGENRIVLTIS
ncbi:MAG: N,N'-diacetylchitobiose phosphorylase [Lachnospiraceae bacterium]|nr:N,N'-diacetylchitobiose phosphorylase [Lachnospiraceae bacterium]